MRIRREKLIKYMTHEHQFELGRRRFTCSSPSAKRKVPVHESIFVRDFLISRRVDWSKRLQVGHLWGWEIVPSIV